MLSSRKFPVLQWLRNRLPTMGTPGDSDSTRGQGTKIPYSAEQLLSPHIATMTTKDPACHNQDLMQPSKQFV